MVKAVVVAEQGATPDVTDIVLPAVGPTDVRVRVVAAGVCHSDLSLIDGTLAPQFPLALGHEASGTVAEVGPGVAGVAKGDRVVLNWAPACRRCWYCLHAQPWLCTAVENLVSPARGHLADGTAVHAAVGLGAFAEEIVVPARAVVPLAEGIPLDLAAFLGCAVLTGVGAVRNTAGVRSAESVLVLGIGGIGLSAVLGARMAGAGPIIAADVSAEKEPLARAAGATHFLVSEPSLSKQVRGLTGSRGVDHSFECVGKPATIRLAWQSTRRGGRCVVVGVGRRTDDVTFNALELFHFSRTLTSSIYGSGDPARDVPALAEQILLGRLDLAVLVSDRIGLDGVPDAFDRMRAGRGARSLIEVAT